MFNSTPALERLRALDPLLASLVEVKLKNFIVSSRASIESLAPQRGMDEVQRFDRLEQLGDTFLQGLRKFYPRVINEEVATVIREALWLEVGFSRPVQDPHPNIMAPTPRLSRPPLPATPPPLPAAPAAPVQSSPTVFYQPPPPVWAPRPGPTSTPAPALSSSPWFESNLAGGMAVAAISLLLSSLTYDTLFSEVIQRTCQALVLYFTMEFAHRKRKGRSLSGDWQAPLLGGLIFGALAGVASRLVWDAWAWEGAFNHYAVRTAYFMTGNLFIGLGSRALFAPGETNRHLVLVCVAGVVQGLLVTALWFNTPPLLTALTGFLTGYFGASVPKWLSLTRGPADHEEAKAFRLAGTLPLFVTAFSAVALTVIVFWATSGGPERLLLRIQQRIDRAANR